jgi:hypothetical protein
VPSYRGLVARGRGRGRRSRGAARSPSRVDACNPLLQAHPTWARDKYEGRGISTPLSLSLRLPFSPLHAPSRADPSGLGHAATFHSSVQGPPGLETPTYSEVLNALYKMSSDIIKPKDPKFHRDSSSFARGEILATLQGLHRSN